MELLKKSTNTFSAVGPSNTAVTPTLGKSSYVDPSQYLDDPDMPALEEITYSDNEEDVGAEADFSNLETNITVSPIPITRVYKDHHVTQIIGDLSLAPQTKSMTRMVKQQDKMSRDVITAGLTMRIPLLYRVSLAGTTSNVPPPLKDKSMWTGKEKKNQKIDRLARSLLIQGLSSDIYSLIDSNNSTKELCDALERHMLGSEYGEQDSVGPLSPTDFNSYTTIR
nr:hypothetical protein [Tanacetum cinerariifolium]